MTEAVYEVVFRGKILDGFSKEQVEAAFARLFGLNGARLEQMFSQQRVVLKKGLRHDEAVRYRDLLQRLGAAVGVETPMPARPVAARPAPVPQAFPNRAAAPAAAVPQTVQADVAAVEPVKPVKQSGEPSRPHVQTTVGAPAIKAAGAPPVMGTRSKAADQASPRLLPFEFHGEGFEFFRIWIVNILLSIVTLGIYSAWAKVRTQRYFYGNTQLDGSSFDYLADPVKILKGRLIAFACLVVYSVVGELSVALGAVMGVLFIAALPWIIIRGLSFRNSNSAWRGVRFGFDGSYGAAAMAFLVWPLLGMLTLGILMPLALQKQQRFIAGGSRYGTSHFEFDIGARPFYMLFLAVLGIGVVGGVLSAVLMGVLPVLVPVVGSVTYLVLFAFFNVQFTNLVYGNLTLGDNHLVAQYELGSYIVLMLVNMIGLVLTLGLFYPWAKVRNARYAAEHMALQACDDLDGFVAARREEISSLGGELGDLFDVELAL